ncbi:MAG: glutamine-hydrolyzing GMP synthase [Candidatus Levybacteria bacterium]|nr:glutamine-hydrolyzing GMP synthase [Candidatus Levybacteria bacterium]
MIAIIDFGSQTTHLISRRLKELGISYKILPPEGIVRKINKKTNKGIILSGGPSSVYAKNAPTIDSQIFSLDIPMLGICYGFQLAALLLGGKVINGKKEYGPSQFKIQNSKFKITDGLSKSFRVWMSHGDEIIKLPKGFKIIGSTEHVPFAFAADFKKKIFGVQFHPEVEHTEFGKEIFKNFIYMCDMKIQNHVLDIKKIEKEIKEKVGKTYVIGAVSGGVDSTVASVLTAKAIGRKFIPVYVDNGLMRDGTREHLKKIFAHINIKLRIINAQKETLKKLKGVSDPEKKRVLIGKSYIKIFEREMKRLKKQKIKAEFLLQGTIYSDVIESGAQRSPAEALAKGDKGAIHAARIKSHHNVGGLPKNMKLKLLEPVRNYYKDEVREIGRRLDLPSEFTEKQPFPGPGFAIRIRGEVTETRLKKQKKADNIILEELKKAKILEKVFLSFPVLTNAFSTAVKGDGRVFGEVIALRVVESNDVMTSSWAKIPYEVLQRISSRIVNEVQGVSRVVYDITTKPPATMEWE